MDGSTGRQGRSARASLYCGADMVLRGGSEAQGLRQCARRSRGPERTASYLIDDGDGLTGLREEWLPGICTMPRAIEGRYVDSQQGRGGMLAVRMKLQRPDVWWMKIHAAYQETHHGRPTRCSSACLLAARGGSPTYTWPGQASSLSQRLALAGWSRRSSYGAGNYLTRAGFTCHCDRC